jgi:hypothetical protein
MLIKVDGPIEGVVFSPLEYLEILRADAAAWSVPEILIVTGERKIA